MTSGLVGRVVPVSVVAALASAGSAWSAPVRPVSGLSFEQAFSVRGEPGRLHYVVAYAAGPAGHRLEVWRDGDRRIRRDTDGALKVYATHKPGEAEFRLDVLDVKRRIHTQITRTNMYRIGSFTDWFDLGHGLKHPRGAYRLTEATTPAGAPSPLEPCRWYDLAAVQAPVPTSGGARQAPRPVHVCWSVRVRLPLLIVSPAGAAVWRVTEVDEKPLPSKAFAMDDRGFVKNNASQDIESD